MRVLHLDVVSVRRKGEVGVKIGAVARHPWGLKCDGTYGVGMGVVEWLHVRAECDVYFVVQGQDSVKPRCRTVWREHRIPCPVVGVLEHLDRVWKPGVDGRPVNSFSVTGHHKGHGAES